MKRTIVSVVCGAALCAAISPIVAMAAKNPAKTAKQGKANVIVERLKEQQLRIKEGVKSGELTKTEVKQLKVEVKAFRAEVKAAKANGKISPEEKARLQAERYKLIEEVNARKGRKK